MASRRSVLAALPLAMLLTLASAAVAFAAGQPPVNLGTSSTYGVLAGRMILNSGTTYVTGDAGTADTNMPDSTIILTPGTWNLGNPAGQAAVVALGNAIADAAGRGPATILTSSPGNGNLGGRTLLPGVYRNYVTESGLSLVGTLTLDAQGDPNAVWVFQSPGPEGALMTDGGSHVVLINGARFCRVFWQARFVRLGADSDFEGHVLAGSEIAAGREARVHGQLMALGDGQADGIVSLNSNTIDNSICTTWTPTPRLPKTGYPPEKPGFPWLVLVFVAGIIAVLSGAAVSRMNKAQRWGECSR
jgi:hypothetical protein